ncbi:MAG: 16S rRNA (adenine(1518)-N(6)/adenine(1519)-N(6))-dimethyltransferase RsmA [Planctomycetota bacterium]
MQTLADIKALLAERGLSPRKRFGQNFLLDHNLIGKLVDASGVGADSLVLEIGPGTGALTEALLDRGATVIACELDRGLADLLRERLADRACTLIEGDALAGKRALNPAIIGAIDGRPFRLVANLPYNAGTPIITTLLADHDHCEGLYVTVQREVGDRLIAPPGSDLYGAVGVLAQLVASVERVALLRPECFWPRPDVTSAMIAIRPHGGAPPIDRRRRVVDLAQRLFSSRRKQLGSTLKGLDAWPAGVDPTQRPESLSPEQFAALAELVPP